MPLHSHLNGSLNKYKLTGELTQPLCAADEVFGKVTMFKWLTGFTSDFLLARILLPCSFLNVTRAGRGSRSPSQSGRQTGQSDDGQANGNHVVPQFSLVQNREQMYPFSYWSIQPSITIRQSTPPPHHHGPFVFMTNPTYSWNITEEDSILWTTGHLLK